MTRLLQHIKPALPECEAAGVVDLARGTLLSAEADGEQAMARLDAASDGVAALIDDDDARTVAAILDRARGGAGTDAQFQDAMVRAGSDVYAIARESDGTRAVTMSCAGATNLGRVMVTARALREIPPKDGHGEE